jgi:signal transduction histidine kinase
MNRLIDSIPQIDLLTDDEIHWLLENSTEIELQPGEILFREGVVDERFYIVLEGELQVTRTINGVQRVLGTTPRGIIGGELALLNGGPQPSTSKAIAPTRLMMLDKQAFRQIFTRVSPLGMYVLNTAAQRMSGIATRLTQDEKMAALGKFAAGLAHELNNPAAAARRSAQALHELLPEIQRRSMQLCAIGLSGDQLDRLLAAEEDFARRAEDPPRLSPLEQSDREDELGDWLSDLGLSRAYEMAPTFVSSGIAGEELDTLIRDFPEGTAPGVLEWLHSALYAANLLCEVDDTTTRISDLVRAVKEYTYMDQGRIQEVDVHKSLENTLKVLGHKVKHLTVVREYDPDLPRILASGGELSQVWTNLIDNAIDALEGRDDPRIRLITRCESDFVMVEVNDNGVGIPADHLPRLFEPFFTTKGVGQGTGLGLDIVYRIIQQHHGTIEVQSQPGSTRFIVRLPIQHSNANE